MGFQALYILLQKDCSMKKSVFVNFYGNQNFGDDAFVYLLAKRYPMTTFIVSGNKEKLQAFEKVSNIKVKNISIIQRIVSKILNKASKTVDSLYQYRAKKCDYIVTIGGSLFIEPDYCSLEEYFSFKRSRFIDDKKNVILGANFGPYRNEAFYDFFKSEFKKYAYVTFRDLKSYRMFSELPNVHYAPDILFGIKNITEVERSHKQERYVVIQVINKGQNLEKYISKNLELIDYYYHSGLKIKLLSLCEDEGDYDVAKRIAAQTQNNVEVLNYVGNLDKVISAIKDSEYVVGARFHSIVSALAFAVPCLPISYSNKTDNLLEDIKFKGISTTIQNFSDMTIDEIDKNRVNKYVANVDQQIRDSSKHFKYLDSLLKEI